VQFGDPILTIKRMINEALSLIRVESFDYDYPIISPCCLSFVCA